MTDYGRGDYASTIDMLVQRIVALGPQILTLDSPWGLFKIEGFDCKDIGPSLAQASGALAEAKLIVAEANR